MLSIRSPAFADHASMPRRYTAEGENLSPPLEWSGMPPGTKSVALIMDDPDAPDPAAPQRTFVHWVLYQLPVGATALPAGASSSGLPPGTRQGLNDQDRAQYSGPAPPIGRHRYFIKLYALDRALPELEHPTKARLEAAMDGHVLASAELVGTYQKGS